MRSENQKICAVLKKRISFITIIS